MTEPDRKLDRIIRPRELGETIGISQATLRRWSSSGRLPKPLKFSERFVGWRASVIQEWLDSRPPTA